MLLLALLALGCKRPAPPVEAPEPAPSPEPADASTAWDDSQRKLEASLAKLEALRAQAQAEPPPPPQPSPAPPPDAPVPDAGPPANLGARWAEVFALIRDDKPADALVAARDAWAQERPLSPAGVKALLLIHNQLVARAHDRWDADCPALVDALDRLPETEASARTALAGMWAALAHRAAAAKDVKLARKLARHALQLEEVFPPAFFALGRAAHVESDFDEAEKYYERAARGSTDPAQIRGYRAQLEALAKEKASLPSGRKASENFAVFYDPRQDEDAARLTLEVLDRARKDVGALFDLYPNYPIAVVLYAGESFNAVKHTSWSAAFYDGRVKIPSGGATSSSLLFSQTLFHEYAHGLFQQATGDGRGSAPTWLNEGLASVAGDLPAPAPLDGCRVGHTFPLRSLEGPFGTLDSRRAHLAYVEARHAAERLREAFGASQLQAMLREVNRQKSFPAAFERTFSASYTAWAEKFDAEAKR